MAAFAVSAEAASSEEDQGLIFNDAVLVAVHHSSYSEAQAAKSGLDQLTEIWRKSNRPSVYLVEYDEDIKGWVGNDRLPNFLVRSTFGENSIFVRSSVVLTGGFFADCLSRAIQSIIRNHFAQDLGSLNIHILMPATFLHSELLKKIKLNSPTLLDLYEKMGVEYFINGTLAKSPPGLVPTYKDIDLQQYQIRYFFDGKVQAVRGKGYPVDINFWSNQNSMLTQM